jgi:hypothetical protein
VIAAAAAARVPISASRRGRLGPGAQQWLDEERCHEGVARTDRVDDLDARGRDLDGAARREVAPIRRG